MRPRIINDWLLICPLAAALLSACGSTTGTGSNGGIVMRSEGKTYLVDGSGNMTDEVAGAYSGVSRYDDRVGVSIQMTGITPKTVMTLWIMVFNSPAKCTHPDAMRNTRCTAADLDTADGGLIYGGQGLAGKSGLVRMSSTLVKDDMAFVTKGSALKDAANADVSILVRNHGTIDLSTLKDQLTKTDCAPTCADYALSPHTVTMANGFGTVKLTTGVYFVDSNPKDGINDCLAGQMGLVASMNAQATVVRERGGVDTNMVVYGLNPGEAYSSWFVVFNNWDKCTTACAVGDEKPRCSASDINNPDVNTALVGPISAGIAATDGSIHIAGHLDKDDVTKMPSAVGPGLVRPLYADIHITLRSHGPINAKTATLAVSQFNEYSGGCNPKCTGFTTAPNEYAKQPAPDLGAAGGH